MKSSLAEAACCAFEVKIYNRKARELARQGAANDDGERHCADLTSRVIRARDAAEARLMAERNWPEDQGYVISSVAAVTLQ